MIKAYSGFIQVRAGKGSEKDKVYVKGYASIPNKQDLYNYIKQPNGTTRTFKSLFTTSCIEDMQKQMMNKAIFIDGMHKTAADLGIVSLAKKYNFSNDDLHDVEEALKMKELPIAKLIEFDIDDNGLRIGTETNPHFAKVDTEHQKYYEAITGSLLDGYLKGYSINFDPIECVTQEDDKGNQEDYINKVNLYGISYTDSPALADNQFTEVCMRSLGNFMKVRTMEGNETKEPKKEDATAQPPEPKKEQKQPELDIKKAIEEGVKTELDKRKAETEQETIKRERDEYKQQIEDLKKVKEPQGQPQGIVPPQDKYGQPILGNEPDAAQIQKEGMEALEELKQPVKDYIEQMRRPTAENEIGIKKFYGNNLYDIQGRLMALQHEFHLHKNPLPGESNEQYQLRQAQLTGGTADMSIKHTAKFN